MTVSGIIEARRFTVYSEQVTVRGIIKASGFPGTISTGKSGSTSGITYATGAAHGGNGGGPSGVAAALSYGSYALPSLPGSAGTVVNGGGMFVYFYNYILKTSLMFCLVAGLGGGVINITALILQVSGIISVRGIDGTTISSGGSGGSLAIFSNEVLYPLFFTLRKYFKLVLV